MNEMTLMTEYKVDVKALPTIRKMFHGYIFRRSANGQGFVRATEKEAKMISSAGIEMTEFLR